jgi:hypothetical protein
MPENERIDTQKLDVGPCRRHVQEGANHVSVLLLVHELSVLVRVKHCSCTHQCRLGLRVAHLELLEDVLRVLCNTLKKFHH